MRVPIVVAMLLTLVFGQASTKQRAGIAPCQSEMASINFLTKPDVGWDISFAKNARLVREGPYILPDKTDSGLVVASYETEETVFTLPHFEVDIAKHSGTVRDWFLKPKQVLGFKKNGHLFAYRVWVQMMGGPTTDSPTLGSNTHVVFYDMKGNGVFESVRLASGIETPVVPEWVNKLD